MFKKMMWLSIQMVALGICIGCSKQDNQKAPFERPLPVKTAEVTQRDIPIYVEVIGTISGSVVVNIRPQVSGRVTDVYVDGGQDVRAGDLLYKIDSAPYEAALQQAKATLIKDQAQLEFAKKKLERYSEVKSDFVSKISLEEFKRDTQMLEGQILLDKAQIDLAQLNVDYCYVKAPIDGRIKISTVDPGNLVIANDANALTQIIQINPIYVYFSIPQKEFQEFQKILQQGRKQFDVFLPFGSQDVFKGEVVALNNEVDATTGTIQIKGLIPNEEKILWPGEFVKVRLFLRMKRGAVVVPSSAIQVGQKGSYVYVLQPDHTVDMVLVETSEEIDNVIVVDKGLQTGMIVITDGQGNLKPGSKVLTPEDITKMSGKGPAGKEEHKASDTSSSSTPNH